MSTFTRRFPKPNLDAAEPGLVLLEVSEGVRVLAWKGELPQDGVIRIRNGQILVEEERKQS